jgi:hypothetical protein
LSRMAGYGLPRPFLGGRDGESIRVRGEHREVADRFARVS